MTQNWVDPVTPDSRFLTEKVCYTLLLPIRCLSQGPICNGPKRKLNVNESCNQGRSKCNTGVFFWPTLYIFYLSPIRKFQGDCPLSPTDNYGVSYNAILHYISVYNFQELLLIMILNLVQNTINPYCIYDYNG